MFFVKGRSKCDADPWRLGRGQRRRVLPTRKRVSTFSFLFTILSYQFHPQVLLDEPPWEVCARLQCDDHPIPIHRVCWTDRVSIKQTTSSTNTKYADINTCHQCRDRGAAAELGRCARLGGTLRSRSGSSGIENTLKRERLLSGELQPLPRPRLPGPQGADEEAAARGMVRPQLTFWRTLSLLRASWHSLWSGDCFLEIDIEITCACSCSSLLYLYSRQTTETKASRIFSRRWMIQINFYIFTEFSQFMLNGNEKLVRTGLHNLILGYFF